MQSFQESFIQLAIESEALRFGHFTLKSGRVSPYFFNAGHFQSGKALTQLSICYAQALEHANIEYDMLFGPAYKGIPLATSTACALFEHFSKDIPYCFNRKEAKDHGEGGSLVGAELKGKVVIVDDVITAGTAIRESLEIIKQNPSSHVACVLVGLDRQEKGQGELSAISELEDSTGVPVISIINIGHILSYLERIPKYQQEFESILAYAEKYRTL